MPRITSNVRSTAAWRKYIQAMSDPHNITTNTSDTSLQRLQQARADVMEVACMPNELASVETLVRAGLRSLLLKRKPYFGVYRDLTIVLTGENSKGSTAHFQHYGDRTIRRAEQLWAMQHGDDPIHHDLRTARMFAQ